MSHNNTHHKPPHGKEEIPEGFFLKRPIFASVISIIIIIVGLMSLRSLPIEQYPNLVPPQVSIKASYTGASAETVAQNVASLLESEINGVENMIYMESISSNTGDMDMTVTFAIGTDPDQATIDVNNRVQLAVSQLPQEVQRMGVTVLKASSSMLSVVVLTSPDQRFDVTYMSNYALINVIDDLKRIPGVGDVQNFAARDYSMRIWLNPERMQQLKINPSDISAAITEQNAQFAAGRLGEEPMNAGVPITWQITTTGRLQTTEEFGNIILRTLPDGSILRLKDVARIELGAQTYAFSGKQNGAAALPLGIFLSPGANALEVNLAVADKMEELSANFPQGIVYSIPYDTTRFIDIAMNEVVKTLVEAMFLVFIVMYLFLQSWRATLIPCLAVPVSIIGTFGGMALLGFSINLLTMFGLVLAIGTVVDDAIIVIENVERHMADGLNPRQATAKAMAEVTGPVIAVVLVLAAVFVPVAFTGGMAGIMYQQFAMTIVISVIISGIVALTLTPALCAFMLKPQKPGYKPWAFFVGFNNFFDRLTNRYVSMTKYVMRRALLTIVLFIAVIAGTGGLFKLVPTALVPNEDQGYVLSLILLPDGTSMSRTQTFVDEISDAIRQDKNINDFMAFTGIDILSGAMKTNAATIFAMLTPWDERPEPSQSSYAQVGRIFGIGAQYPEGLTLAFNPPPIMGMSNTGGFDVWVQDRSGGTPAELYNATQGLLAAAAKRPELAGLNSTYSVTAPQIYVELDREKARTLGVGVSDVFAAMQATFGSYYVNDFNLYGRTFRVFMQSEASMRADPENLRDVSVRNSDGDMVPITSLLTIKRIGGPQTAERFNNFPAAKVMGGPAPGYSSGQAIAAINEIAQEALPEGFTIAWTGSAYQEQLVTSDSMLVMALGLVMVFLILAAQYESWSLPLTVLTIVPFAALGAISANYLRGLSNDVYFQVAIVTLIGLSSKNAILIVEFAVELYRKEGMSIIESAEEAIRLRFRPILMTSLTFILGCLPLAIATGAGAASRHSVGTSVIGGMLVATAIGPMFVPFFFRWVMTGSEKFAKLMGKGDHKA